MESISVDAFYSCAASSTFVRGTSSSSVAPICQSFKRQQESFDFFDSLSDEQKTRCKTYSYEVLTGKGGAYRRYLVCDFDSFFESYTEKFEFQDEPPSQRGPESSKHAYEVIRDKTPCRAYFDVEFPCANNCDVNGESLTATWIQLVLFKIYHLWGFSLGSDDVIVLDSTSEDKFSKHVIIIIPGDGASGEVLFADNLAVGALVAEVLADITYSSNGVVRPLKEYEFLWIRNKNDEFTFFVDLSVYTRNRLFRLLWSTKAGKAQQLTLTPWDKKLYSGLHRAYKGIPGDKASRIRSKREALERSFVVPFDVHKVLLRGAGGCITVSARAQPLRSTDVVVRDESGIKISTSVIQSLSKSSGAGWGTSNVIEESSVMPSVFPDIDKVVLHFLGTLGSGLGSVKSWCLYATSHKPHPAFRIRYMICGTKYCLNVSREHSSNNVYLEADLTRRALYQRCFSRKSCPGFSSPPVPIPSEVVPDESALLLLQFDKALQVALQQGTIK